MTRTDTGSNGNLLINLAKYGVGSVIALQLVWYMTQSLDKKIDTMIAEMKHGTEIHQDMLQAIRSLSHDNIGYRSGFTTTP